MLNSRSVDNSDPGFGAAGRSRQAGRDRRGWREAVGTLSVLRPIPEFLRPQRSLRSSRALGVPPEATPCSPTPRQVSGLRTDVPRPLLAVPAPRSRPRRAGPAPAASRGSPRLPAWQVGAPGAARGQGSRDRSGDQDSPGDWLDCPCPGFSVPKVWG